MIFPVDTTGVCMILDALEELEVVTNKIHQFLVKWSAEGTIKKFTRREIYEFVFDRCHGCGKMAAVPQGAFAVRKVRETHERNIVIVKMEKKEGDDRDNRGSGFKKNLTEGRELTPLKYNSKLMNSIWGLYNRYSVHNFKKNTDPEGDAETTVFTAAWGSFFERDASASATSAEVVGNAAAKH
uniref:WDR6 protein n=1 Tax=Fopius arisanus TaxID=64838 RepID=A0A0C9QPR6_9HYME